MTIIKDGCEENKIMVENLSQVKKAFDFIGVIVTKLINNDNYGQDLHGR